MHFWPLKGPFWPFEALWQPAKRSNGDLPENQSYPELPHDVGKLWSHWVGSIGAQKWGLHGTKRIEFLAQNMHFLGPIGLIWAQIWPIFCAADQLIGSVSSGAGCISQDTYLLYKYSTEKYQIIKLDIFCFWNQLLQIHHFHFLMYFLYSISMKTAIRFQVF